MDEMLPVILSILGIGVLSLGAVYFFQPSLIFVTYIAASRWTAGVTQKEAVVGKVKYVYSERGQQKSGVTNIILVHGFSSSRDSWNWVIKNLPRDVHVVAVDLPGHGDTKEDPDEEMKEPYQYYVDNLKKLIDKIGLGGQPLHLVGLSMGGAIVGLYGATYPENVKLITFVCPAMETPVQSKLTRDRESMEEKPSPIVETAEEQQESLKYAVYKQMKFPKQFYKAMVDMRRKYVPFLTLLMDRMHEVQNEGILNKVMNKVNAPSQIVWGEEDYICHVSGAKLLKEGLQDVRQYDIIPKCGHAMDLEKPDLLTDRILHFRDMMKI